MDPLAALLHRTRSPHPSIQRLAVVSIFDHLRSSPSPSSSDALSQCLSSHFPAVADQSVRESCRLAADSAIPLPHALLELQAALDGCPPALVPVFVKGVGFLCRLGFRKDPDWAFRDSPESHPFAKMLACRGETHGELLHQVLVFIMENKSIDMEKVLVFLKPFVTFAVLKARGSNSLLGFSEKLVSSLADLAFSIPFEAIPVFRFVMACMKHIPCRSSDEFEVLSAVAKHLVDSYIGVLKQLAATELLRDQVQVCGVEIVETLFSCISRHRPPCGCEVVVELSKCLISAQKVHGFPYLTKFKSVVTSLVMVLSGAEFEHEQICTLKLAFFLLKWKEEEYTRESTCDLREELLFVFPVLSLLSSSSKSPKTLATDLLALLEGRLANFMYVPVTGQHIMAQFPVKVEDIIQRLLYHLLIEDKCTSPMFSFLRLSYDGMDHSSMVFTKRSSWISLLKHFLCVVTESKNSGGRQPVSQQIVRIGIPSLLCSIMLLLVMHPTLGTLAADSFAVIPALDATLGMPILITVLFLNRLFCHVGYDSSVLLELLVALPQLASDSVMVPLVLQTILPMLQENRKPVLYATGIRLLCKTWMTTDRIFGSLQDVLRPAAFSKFSSNKEICLSMASSVLDVCKKDPDRGVDLILSISACIESPEPFQQSLGFESLAHLCEADVVDFYSAWDVVSRYMLNYSSIPVVAHGLSILLRWGAMDAAAYPKAAQKVVQILWEIGTIKSGSDLLWVKARTAAFLSLINYEVEDIRNCISDFSQRNVEVLVSEEVPEVLKEIEKFEVKIINFEHRARRRFQKEKKHSGNRIRKLLDIVPQIIFSSGSSCRELPAAALLSFSSNSKDILHLEKSKDSKIIQNGYVNVFMEIAESLQLSRNIVIALLVFQSWKPFMHQWARAVSRLSISNKNISILALEILKVLCEKAEVSIPRSAESMALAIGALCTVLPSSSHSVASTAVKFLMKWLYQYEHEYRQWTSALSLGLLSSGIRIIDSQQYYEIVAGLLEVASVSGSKLVKGACGTGLGFTCHGLMSNMKSSLDSSFGKETSDTTEHRLLRNIIGTLSSMISQLCPSAVDSLQGLCLCFEPTPENIFLDKTNADTVKFDCLEEDVWGAAGLVLGLGNSITALYKGGYQEMVLMVKDIMMTWISGEKKGYTGKAKLELPLSIGSCFVLPSVLAFSWRMELINDEIDHIVAKYTKLVNNLLDEQNLGRLHQSLLMTSCIGVGNLVSYILDEGVHLLTSDDLKSLLELMRKAYTHEYSSHVHLGGLLGVVNVMGAGAGIIVDLWPRPSFSERDCFSEKEKSHVRGPLLLNPVYEQLCMTLLQEIFSVARNKEDMQLRQNSAWALAFLRHHWVSKEYLDQNISRSDSPEAKQLSQNIAEDTVVWQLSSWLRDLNVSEKDARPPVQTVATVMRCLSKSPRLPSLGWGPLVRRLMKYEDQVPSTSSIPQKVKCGVLREECIKFSIAHANSVGSLLVFLDELVEISRFKTLALNLQCSLLSHIGSLSCIFSESRLDKLFADLFVYITSSSCEGYNLDATSLLRTSFWKGLYECLLLPSSESKPYISRIEKCMEVLFHLLPGVPFDFSQEGVTETTETEWVDAVKCLGKARYHWLTDILRVPYKDIAQTMNSVHGVGKKIKAMARLVSCGCISMEDLRKLTLALLKTKFDGVWDILLEIVAVVHKGEGITKRQWLLDAVDISCITNYPSTAFKFVGLLCSSRCQYMPLLIVDQTTVLSDLAVTIPSLLSDSSWSSIAESVVPSLWVSTERINAWNLYLKDKGDFLDFEPIDSSESDISIFLARVLHHTCLALIDHLPFDKQLKLTNMVLL